MVIFHLFITHLVIDGKHTICGNLHLFITHLVIDFIITMY